MNFHVGKDGNVYRSDGSMITYRPQRTKCTASNCNEVFETKKKMIEHRWRVHVK